jgi:hypothetical protein
MASWMLQRRAREEGHAPPRGTKAIAMANKEEIRFSYSTGHEVMRSQETAWMTAADRTARLRSPRSALPSQPPAPVAAAPRIRQPAAKPRRVAPQLEDPATTLAKARLHAALARSIGKVGDLFKAWDADGSGAIDRREHRAICLTLGLVASEETCDAVRVPSDPGLREV